jgi:hypothetical protein
MQEETMLTVSVRDFLNSHDVWVKSSLSVRSVGCEVEERHFLDECEVTSIPPVYSSVFTIEATNDITYSPQYIGLFCCWTCLKLAGGIACTDRVYPDI